MYKIFVCVILLCQFSLAQLTEDILQCAHVEEVPMMKTVAVPGGSYITAKGDLHALVVFVQFPDDPISRTDWPINQPPSFLGTFFDNPSVYPSGSHNLSNYFYEMSKTNGTANQLNLTGEGMHVILDNTRGQYVTLNKKISQINIDALNKIDLLDNNLQRFDNWTFGSGPSAHNNVKDGVLDMVFIVYRNVYHDNIYFVLLQSLLKFSVTFNATQFKLTR